MSKGIATIQALTTLLPVMGGEDGFTAHCIGVETGIRFVMRHPEYARLLLMHIDEEMKRDGCDAGRVDAEKAIDTIIRTNPLEAYLVRPGNGKAESLE